MEKKINFSLTPRQVLVGVIVLVIGVILLSAVVHRRMARNDVWLPPGVSQEEYEQSLKESEERSRPPVIRSPAKGY